MNVCVCVCDNSQICRCPLNWNNWNTDKERQTKDETQRHWDCEYRRQNPVRRERWTKRGSLMGRENTNYRQWSWQSTRLTFRSKSGRKLYRHSWNLALHAIHIDWSEWTSDENLNWKADKRAQSGSLAHSHTHTCGATIKNNCIQKRCRRKRPQTKSL